MRILMYDCEIINCIPCGERKESYSYCDGWREYKNMGISVVGTWRNYDVFMGGRLIVPLPLGKYEAFVNHIGLIGLPLQSYISAFARLETIYSMAERVVGFNSVAFDDNLMIENGMDWWQTDYDLLAEVRVASGQPRHYVSGQTRKGYNLNALAVANLKRGKTGTGELAPELWQDRKRQEVIRYCLNDVKLLKQLYFKFMRQGLIDPTNHTLLQPTTNDSTNH